MNTSNFYEYKEYIKYILNISDLELKDYFLIRIELLENSKSSLLELDSIQRYCTSKGLIFLYFGSFNRYLNGSSEHLNIKRKWIHTNLYDSKLTEYKEYLIFILESTNLNIRTYLT